MSLGSLLGSVGSSIVSAFGQKKANEANRDLSREQMRFQERMSNTSYFRSVADMENAGLNPALAYSKGGATTPSGAKPDFKNPYQDVGPKISQSAKSMAELSNIKQQNKLLKAQTDKTVAEGVSAKEYSKVSKEKALTDIDVGRSTSESSMIRIFSRIYNSAKDSFNKNFDLKKNQSKKLFKKKYQPLPDGSKGGAKPIHLKVFPNTNKKGQKYEQYKK